jgi:hypothetical protein
MTTYEIRHAQHSDQWSVIAGDRRVAVCSSRREAAATARRRASDGDAVRVRRADGAVAAVQEVGD